MPASRMRSVASVGGSSWDDPLLGLAGDLSNQFEVGVVVQHGEVPSLCCRGDQSIDEGEGSVLAPVRKGGLDL